jgi:hypothetical protein
MGRLVVVLSKHLTAVIDAVIHDTYDPQRTTSFYAVVDGKTIIDHISARCVYGYFQERSKVMEQAPTVLPKCEYKIFKDWHSHPCGKRASVQEESGADKKLHWYCKRHSSAGLQAREQRDQQRREEKRKLPFAEKPYSQQVSIAWTMVWEIAKKLRCPIEEIPNKIDTLLKNKS